MNCIHLILSLLTSPFLPLPFLPPLPLPLLYPLLQALFQSRVYIYTWLVALETVAVLMLLVALFKSHHWHQCLSAAALLSVNYYLFYRLLLNRLSLRSSGRPLDT